jgi:vancomycin resistance protein YoaR
MLALKLSDTAADEVVVGLDEVKFKAYLAKDIASVVDKSPIEAKFKVDNGRVTEFQNGQDGLTLDLESSFAKIASQMALSNLPAQAGQIDLVVKLEPTLTNAGNLNDFGIKQIIGVGSSTFSGSPVNRRHNIKVGSDAINGLLIKPGEEFSLIKALGAIDGSTGYLPELVIKDNKTIPEFGGGLCQVGTTMFRTVIASGLPVTMRQNHSYRVAYYEPAGTDATIYDPWPDFRFINDTPTYILIQTKISGDILIFEFWGTPDGRLVEKTKPTIYNIVKPEPAKIIETLDLKPGQKKCTEHAHNGADAYFDYKVTYPDGLIKEKRFSSHYVPWQEVCLLGVEKLSPPAGGPPSTATSTPPISIN